MSLLMSCSLNYIMILCIVMDLNNYWSPSLCQALFQDKCLNKTNLGPSLVELTIHSLLYNPLSHSAVKQGIFHWRLTYDQPYAELQK